MNNTLLEYKIDLIAKHLGVYRIDDVSTVMRRQHISPDDGRIVDVVDFYPPWNQYGTYGKMKICHEYLDEDWQKARFQKFSGFSVEQLPVYDGQTALVRRFGQEHRCEIPVQPFRLMVEPRQDENGNSAKTLILRYLAGEPRQAPKPQTAVSQPAGAKTQPPAKIHADELLRQMNVTIEEPGQRPATNNQQPTTNGQQPAAKTSVLTAVTATEWLQRAREATESFDFDTCIHRAIPFFDSADRVESARVGMFGEWKTGQAAAYVAGIQKYASLRDELEANHAPATAAHKEAKNAALVEYRKVIDAGRQPA